MPKLPALLVLCAVLSRLAGPSEAQEPVPPERLDAAFQVFWNATDSETALAAARSILALDPEFDVVFAHLREGRSYAANAPHGKLLRTHDIGGVPHPYMIFVPEHYDPSHPWIVRWDLHGGMGQPEWKQLDGAWSPNWAAINSHHNDSITVAPAGWWDSMWWEGSQVDNFRAIMSELKRGWNVDENRVFVFGASDGAIAEWFYAFRYPDPWCFYIGYSGFPARLTNRAMRPDGQMHLTNLEGQRFYLRNGARDRIVNIDVMRKYQAVFEPLDVEIQYFEHKQDGHDLYLSNDEEHEPFRLLNEIQRDPLPERLSWSTERTDRYNRRLWLVIEDLADDAEADTTNILPRIHGKNVPRTPPPKPLPWGRVELLREGNVVRATTRGVRRFRLLLSPDEFDFAAPVQVWIDGKPAFDGPVTRDVETLLTWAARDEDRSMLFGAELELEVPE